MKGWVEYEFRLDGELLKRDVLRIECDPEGLTTLALFSGEIDGVRIAVQAQKIEVRFRFVEPAPIEDEEPNVEGVATGTPAIASADSRGDGASEEAVAQGQKDEGRNRDDRDGEGHEAPIGGGGENL